MEICFCVGQLFVFLYVKLMKMGVLFDLCDLQTEQKSLASPKSSSPILVRILDDNCDLQ